MQAKDLPVPFKLRSYHNQYHSRSRHPKRRLQNERSQCEPNVRRIALPANLWWLFCLKKTDELRATGVRSVAEETMASCTPYELAWRRMQKVGALSLTFTTASVFPRYPLVPVPPYSVMDPCVCLPRAFWQLKLHMSHQWMSVLSLS